MKLSEVIKTAIDPALSLLPERMRSKEAVVMLLAIGLQESRFVHTYQLVQGKPGAKGPARGWWQFERMEREAADTAIRMFAELLGGLDEMAEVYAAEVDRRRIAGLACERAYTSGMR